MEPFSLRVRINSTIAKLYYKTYDTSQSLLLNVNPLLISTQNIFYF